MKGRTPNDRLTKCERPAEIKSEEAMVAAKKGQNLGKNLVNVVEKRLPS